MATRTPVTMGSIYATANWRRIAEEIWPFVSGPASTPIGDAEARWDRQRRRSEASLDRSA